MGDIAKKGEWVQIHDIILRPGERSVKIPDETKKVPLELWVKGFLKEDARIGDRVEITTIIGRTVAGELVAVNPTYDYGFGDIYIPELLQVRLQARAIVKGENE
ncbi:MAG: 2-amino-4-oxopentanoate thiolase subunit OrtA [Clostridiaceae bacterium]